MCITEECLKDVVAQTIAAFREGKSKTASILIDDLREGIRDLTMEIDELTVVLRLKERARDVLCIRIAKLEKGDWSIDEEKI